MAPSTKLLGFAIASLVIIAQGYPITQLQKPIFSEDFVPCDSVESYTTNWFLLNTLPHHRQEIHSKALFYTKGTSKQARQLACSSPQTYVTLWDIWPKYLYFNKNIESNPLRCIHNTPDQARVFYENMSEAYARMARKHATVMHAFEDFEAPPLDGIWGRVELPAIQKATDIFALDKINEDRSIAEVFRVPSKVAKDVFDRAIEELRNLWRMARWSDSMKDEPVGSCALWDSEEERFLDGLF